MERSGVLQGAFSHWLRSGAGRWRSDGSRRALEVKFNPWHDPEDGRFTFVGAGRFFPGGGGGGPSGRQESYERFSPRHPNNHSVHVVRRGESLSRIAASRTGLRVSDLAWLNGLPEAARLQVGQRLLLPTQDYLDRSRRARAKFLDLAFYMDTYDGRLPPDLRNVPSIEEQLNSGWRRDIKNGYTFSIDVIERPRRARGELRLVPEQSRSKRAQREAGGADRRATDDGGHFIAARFGGPRDRFNHFAQDASFNRGEYRSLEDSWVKELRAGRRVIVEIIPSYEGASRRPREVRVIWYTGGVRYWRDFPNEKKGKRNGKR